MKIIDTPNMPKANGHYSMCIEHNGLLYLAGQLPVDATTKTVPSTIEQQTDLCLKKIELILLEAGSSKSNVLQVRIYISDIELWDRVNERYSLFFGEHKPVRCVVPTKTLHYGALIEMEATAVL